MEPVSRRDMFGHLVNGEGGKGYYAVAHAALTAGVPYEIETSYEAVTVEGTTRYDAVAVTKACAAEAAIYKRWGVPQKNYAIGEVAFLQCEGEGKMYITGDATHFAVGQFGKIAPGTSAVTGLYEGTTETNSSIFMALEAYVTATSALKKVAFCGGKRIINT